MAASVQPLNLDTPVSQSEPIDTPQNSSSTTSSFDADPPSITRIFNDAALYKQVIEDPERASLILDNESIKDFAELVGKDLDSPEKTLVGRFAQLSVEDLNWSEVGRYTEEPEVYSDEDDSSAESLEKDQELLQEGGETISQETPGFPSSQSEIQRAKLSSKLPPDEIITLLKEEFGELASPEVEERLLIETDAALVQDVILLVYFVDITLSIITIRSNTCVSLGRHTCHNASTCLPCSPSRPAQRRASRKQCNQVRTRHISPNWLSQETSSVVGTVTGFLVHFPICQ